MRRRRVGLGLLAGCCWVAVAGGCSSGSDDGGTGGTCTDPAPLGPGWNLGGAKVEPAAALRAAVMIASCMPDDDPHSYLKDFYWERGGLLDRDPSWIGCVAARSDGCAAVKDCLGLESNLGGPCVPSCNGSVFQACDDSLRFRADCSKLNASCSLDGGCIACHPGPSCDKQSFVGRCDGQVPVNCRDERETAMADCSLLGLKCVVDQDGDARCAGKGAACTGDLSGEARVFGGACNGSKLTACVNGAEHELDCSEIASGFACHSSGGVSFCGLAGECDPELADAACEGNTLAMCNAGKLEKVDCLALGFTGCDSTISRCKR